MSEVLPRVTLGGDELASLHGLEEKFPRSPVTARDYREEKNNYNYYYYNYHKII
jgi:hypothetical protein